MDIIDYKYNEGKILKEVQIYIDGITMGTIPEIIIKQQNLS